MTSGAPRSVRAARVVRFVAIAMAVAGTVPLLAVVGDAIQPAAAGLWLRPDRGTP
jgi:hypothetical protein